MHKGRIVGLGTPNELLATLGQRILELRVSSDPGAALSALRGASVAGDDAFVVGQTLTVPLHDGATTDTTNAVHALGLAAG